MTNFFGAVLAYLLIAFSLLGCSVSPPNNVPNQDDTAYIQAKVDARATIPTGNYITTRTIVLSGASPELLCKPNTTITFKPLPPFVDCKNDRAVTTACDVLLDPGTNAPILPRQITGSISVKAASFTAAADASDLAPGDWLIVSERDGILHVPVVVDWVQVSWVSGGGTTVNIVGAFRTAFPNTHAWVTSPYWGGLGFDKVPATAAVSATIDGCTIQVPDAGSNLPALSVFGARGVTVNNMNLMAFNGQGCYSWLTKGLTITNSTCYSGKQSSEFASTVDLTVSGTSFSSDESTGFALDLGTAFFSFVNNPVPKSFNIGFYLLYGVHDGMITGTHISHVGVVGQTNACGIDVAGSQRVALTGNILDGGTGPASVGLAIGPITVENMIPSTGNVIAPNTFGAGGWSVDYDPGNQP
jgi:hypothetical protein